MLTLYILATSEGNRSVTKTIKSLNGIPNEFSVVGSVDEINNNGHKPDWFLVLYDNEYLSFDLRKAVELMLRMENLEYDAFVFMKQMSDGKLYQSPRLFKKHVRLRKNSLMPEDKNTKMERILDGWVYEHA